jgi:hypothetical protein
VQHIVLKHVAGETVELVCYLVCCHQSSNKLLLSRSVLDQPLLLLCVLLLLSSVDSPLLVLCVLLLLLFISLAIGNEEVEIDARIIKLGRDVGTVEVLLRRVTTGELVASGTHVKKLVGASDLTTFFELVDKQLEQQPRQEQSEEQQQPARAALPPLMQPTEPVLQSML